MKNSLTLDCSCGDSAPAWNLISKTLPSASTTNLPTTVPSISGVSVEMVSRITPFSFTLGYSWRIFCLRVL